MPSCVQRFVLLPPIVLFSLVGLCQTLGEAGHASPASPSEQTAPPAAGSDAGTQLNDAALTRLNQGDYTGAQEFAEKAVGADPRSPYAWNNLGRAYFGQGQMEQAERAFRKQIEVNPNDLYAYNNLGNLLRDTNRREEAIAAYHKQIEIVPRDRFAHKNLGLLLMGLERYSEAVEELEKAADIATDDKKIKAALAQAYRQTGQNDKAQALLRSISPTVVTTDNLYKAFIRDQAAPETALQQTRATLQMLETSFAKNQRTETFDIRATVVAAWWGMAGWSYFKLNQLDDAERYLSAAWIISDYADIGRRLAQVYEKEQRTELAMQTYAEALAGQGSQEDLRERLLRLAGDERAVDEMLQAARTRLSDRRRTILSTSPAASASADVSLVFANGPQPEQVIFRGGSRELFDRYQKAIKDSKFNIMYPDGNIQHVGRAAVLNCGGEGCTVVLGLLSADQPHVVTFEFEVQK
jgi:tetratricopeptide (TPR) repeat protein